MAYCCCDIMKNKIKNDIKKDEINSVYKLVELGFNPIPILKDYNKGRNDTTLSKINNITLLCKPINECINNFNDYNKNDGNENEEKYIKYYSNKDSIAISKENRIFKICGTNNGILFIFDKRNDNNIYKIINDHSQKIIDIFINEKLNLFADISKDGFINIYTIPECELLHSLYLNDEKENLEKIYLSSSPLPAIIIKTNNKLKSYNINGTFLTEINNKEGIKNLINEDFIDYLQLLNTTKIQLPYFS